MRIMRYLLLTFRKVMLKFRHLLLFILVVLVFIITNAYYDTSSTQLQDSELGNVEESKDIYRPTVFFLKVHKSASSTVQNIIMRYGSRYNLNFGLPYVSNYLGHPESITPDMLIPVSKGHSYDIICHHCRFNETSVQRLLPPDTIYVAIIRDPVYLFESIFSYYELSEHYGMSIEEFVNMPSWWFNTCLRKHDRLGLNQIAFDFGIDEKDFADAEKVNSLIDELDRIFDLVLIADHFEESLVLLKHVLNLDIHDITYIAHNERVANEKKDLSQQMIEKLRRINHVDQKIYDHFLDEFHRRVLSFGTDKMAQEVQQLRETNNFWNNACGFRRVKMTTDEDPIYKQFLSHKVHGIEFDKEYDQTFQTCKYLSLPEFQFTTELRKQHIQRHASLWTKILYFLRYYKY